MTGGFGPSCDLGNGCDGSSRFSSQLLRPPQLPSQLAFAQEPERGLLVGSVVVDAIEVEVVVGCSGCVMGGSKTVFTTRNGFMGGPLQRQMALDKHRTVVESPGPPVAGEGGEWKRRLIGE